MKIPPGKIRIIERSNCQWEKKTTSNNQWNVEQLVDINSLPKLQPTQLIEDYQYIETMVLQVHPGTYRYNDEASIQKGLEELKAKFQSPLTHGEAYLAMSKLTAQLKCDHTKVGFNNQKKIINSVIHRQKDKLPFTFQWIEERMMVVYDATEQQELKRGTEVLSINQIPVSDIRAAMMPYIAADGATDQNRIVKMEVDGYDFRYNAFDVFYPLLFPIAEESLTLEIRSDNAPDNKTIKVASLTREERSRILAERYHRFPKNRDDMWYFQVLSGKIGILTLNSFGLMGWKGMTLDYRQFLADAFETLKVNQVEHLIIDIRKNTGGNDEIKNELFTYFDINRECGPCPGSGGPQPLPGLPGKFEIPYPDLGR